MKLLIITILCSVYYMYMYCYYFIIQGWSFIHQAANYSELKILDVMLKNGGDSNIQDDVSDYILFVIHM